MQRECTVEAVDGTSLYYTVEGEGPVDFALADGIGCDGFIWRYLEPMLLERGRVLHLHMRGHGRSALPAEPARISIPDLADDWGAVFAACGTRRAIVLGHSMGVQVSLETWHRQRAYVAGLALLCGSFENPVGTFHDGPMLRRALPVLQGAARLGGRALERAWNRLVRLPMAFHVARITEIHPDLTRRRDFEPYLDHLSAMNPALFFQMLGEAGSHSARPYLQDIDVPTLVVAGADDRFTPARLSDEMAERIGLAELLTCPEGTHTAPLEHPTLINLHVGRLIDAVLLREAPPAPKRRRRAKAPPPVP